MTPPNLPPLILTALTTSPDYHWQETELAVHWTLDKDGTLTHSATLLHHRIMLETGDRVSWQSRTPLPGDQTALDSIMETLADAGVWERMAERLEADPTLETLSLS